VLPDTDLDGAFAAGEQIRRAAEAVRVEWPGGAPLREGERRGCGREAGDMGGAYATAWSSGASDGIAPRCLCVEMHIAAVSDDVEAGSARP
jgi:hypothetical protein